MTIWVSHSGRSKSRSFAAHMDSLWGTSFPRFNSTNQVCLGWGYACGGRSKVFDNWGQYLLQSMDYGES